MLRSTGLKERLFGLRISEEGHFYDYGALTIGMMHTRGALFVSSEFLPADFEV